MKKALSFSVLALSALAALSYFGTHNTIKPEAPKVSPPPSTEQKVDPTPTIPEEKLIALPTITASPVVISAPKPAPFKVANVVQAKLSLEQGGCNMVCEDRWRDSSLMVGGQYKRCECK